MLQLNVIALVVALIFASRSIALRLATTSTSRRQGMSRHMGLSSSAEILSLVEGTDSGETGLSPANKVKVDSWVDEKVNSGKQQYIDKDKLLGNYYVSYVSAGKSQRGNPAGGNYRGRIGRILFKTTGLYQHLLDDGGGEKITVVNLVVGKLLLCLELNVVLKGLARALTDKEKKEMDLGVNAIEAEFEAPRIMLRFGSALNALIASIPGVSSSSALATQLNRLNLLLQIGPPSSVILDTPYVDDSLRAGIGGRGSLFVFKRIEDSTPEFTKSEIWRQLITRRPVDARSASVYLSFLGAYCGFIGRRLTGFALSLAAVALAYWKGGKSSFITISSQL